jgi:hypothetical protein
MNLEEVQIGKKYRCDWEGHQYFATVLRKQSGRVLVSLGDRINAQGDPDDPVLALGWIGYQWADPGKLHEL